MKNSFIFSIVAVAGGMLISGCAATTNPYIAAKQLADIPETNHLVKVVSYDFTRYKVVSYDFTRYTYQCSAVSLGKGLYLTSAYCVDRSNYVIGLDGERHDVTVVKQGHEYRGGNFYINEMDENWAILYTEDLMLPSAKISDANGLSHGQTMCTVYFTQPWLWSSTYIKPTLTPIKACGNTGAHNDLGHIITLENLKQQRGMFGAPVFDSVGKVTGIITYIDSHNFKNAGILPVSVFRDAIKETRL